MSERKRLEKALDQAQAALDRISGEKSAERNKRLETFVQSLDAELSEKYDSDIDEASRARGAAREALDRHKESNVEIPKWCPPLGTKLEQWNMEHWTRRWDNTGLTGVVEVYKEGDPYPNNLSWSGPNPGDIIIRRLKKDGGRSSRFIFAREWEMTSWKPVGWQPPKDNR